MVIDGRPGLACRTLTKNLGAEITLAPLPVFELIADLSVNTGKWMRAMSERLQTWVHMKEAEPDLRRIEEPMDPDLAEKIYLLDRCIECGCCVAGCGTARMREDFVGAVGSTDRALRLDPRDTCSDDDFYGSSATTAASSAACVAVSPRRVSQEPPLQTQIAFIRRNGEGLEVGRPRPTVFATRPAAYAIASPGPLKAWAAVRAANVTRSPRC
jgi:fumarate reductase iron-sulfur subunit